MGGMYLSCGDFSGEDKSASPMPNVVKDLEAGLGGQAGKWFEEMLGECDPEEGVAYRIIPTNYDILLSNLETLLSSYRSLFPNIDDWYQIFELEVKGGMDPTKGKYGQSVGWKISCTTDLIKAVKTSLTTGDEILVHFD